MHVLGYSARGRSTIRRLTAARSSAAAPSSPADSLGSDAMEESDSDDDEVPAAPRDDLVEYPLEGKYKDAADRAYINSLPQLERERILGERAEEMNKMQWNSELQRRVAQRSGASELKRKASSVEPDDAHRKTNRQKTSSAIESYKQYREERQQQRQRHEDRRRSLSPDRRHGSDIDADGESDVDYPEYDDIPRRDEPADLHDYETIRVGRDWFAKVCFDPNFDAAMPGAFVRVAAGTDPTRRAPLYKMAQIKGMFALVLVSCNGTDHIQPSQPASLTFSKAEAAVLLQINTSLFSLTARRGTSVSATFPIRASPTYVC